MGDFERGQIVVSGQPFDPTLAFLVDRLGFRLDLITPADDPARAVLSGHGMTVCLDRTVAPAALTLRLPGASRASATGPNGMTVEFVAADEHARAIPDLVPEVVIARQSGTDTWVTGRAGMRYRDLIPSRLGGRFIASHIEVCDGGPIADLVHHHAIRFQLIFCLLGWVDVVYEDQGPPFRMEAGDAVLQPPHIRHKVLASSPGAQVIEVGCPAEHDTLFDHDLLLPNDAVDPGRVFGGQLFVRHDAASASWIPGPYPGFEQQVTAIGPATAGLADVRIVQAAGGSRIGSTTHTGEFFLTVVTEGAVRLAIDGRSHDLALGDAFVAPALVSWSLPDVSHDARLLQVSLA